MRTTTMLGMVVAVGVATLSAACIPHDTDELVQLPQEGQVDITYTIDGSTDARACEAAGAESFEVLIAAPRSARGEEMEPYASANVACGDFRVHVELPSGEYEGVARLLDADGEPVTADVPLGRFRLSPDSIARLEADFTTRTVQ